MKILVAGDLHFDKKKFHNLLTMLPDCDVLCLTGDYLDDRLGHREEQVEWVCRWISRINIPIVMCSGNHDLDDLAESQWIDNLACSSVITDNHLWRHAGITFGAVPYIGAQYEKYKNCDVLVTHLPPSHTGTSIENGADFGDDELYFSIICHKIAPKYVLCGHVEHPDQETDEIENVKIINVGSKPRIVNM